MLEFDIKVNPQQHLAYIPKQIIRTLGTQLKMLPNERAAILYANGTRLEDVVASIEILIATLKLRIEIDQRQEEILAT